MAEILVKYKFKHLTISIDGATPETYAIYRRGGDYNKVIENIKKIQKYKKIYNSEYPELEWQFIVFGHNEHEIELAKDNAKKLNMEILFKHNMVQDYSPTKNKDMILAQTGLYDNEDFRVTVLAYINTYMCHDIFDEPQINFDGILVGCCASPSWYGVNVFKEGLMKALNSRMFVEAKHMITDLTYTPASVNIPCSSCGVYELMKKENICLTKFS